MSVRADIVANLKTALEGITVDNSYESTVVNVSPFTQRYIDAPRDQFPWVLIHDGDNEELAAEDGDNVVFYLPIQLQGIVCVDTDIEITGAVNKLLSDLKTFIYSNPGLGDNVRAIQYRGTAGNYRQIQSGALSSGGASVSKAYTVVLLRIIYACARGTF